jgi:hypothetical protein
MKWKQSCALLAIAVLALLATSCKTMEPGTIIRDRSDYSRAIADSWKDQTLLNIVKVRYLDLPIFLDVASVVSGYQLETSASIGGVVSSSKAVQGDYLSLGAAGRYTDRPTITYSPRTGDKFLEGMIKPMSPVSVIYMLQAGYAADFILELTVDSLNGLRNRTVTAVSKRQADPEFFKALHLIREIQDEAGLGIKVESGKEGKATAVMFFRSDDDSPDTKAKVTELAKLLKLSPDQSRYPLIYSPIKENEATLSMATRSIIQILQALARGVDLPAEHVARKLPVPLPPDQSGIEPLIHIHSGHDKPADAFIAIRYEDAWFWIANDDWRSKRTFVVIMFLFSLSETGESGQKPIITIPAQ